MLRFWVFIFILASHGFLCANSDILVTNPPDSLPVKVDTTVYLWNLSGIDEKMGTFNAEIYLTLKWEDDRLAFKGNRPKIYTDKGAIAKLETIWWPQIDFINASNLEERNQTLIISPDGSVEYSLKILGSFFSKMDLSTFPFDKQDYEIHLQSFLWDVETVEFVINKAESRFLKNTGIKSLRPTNLSLNVTKVPFMSWVYSDVGLNIHFVRNPGFFNYQILIPLIIVILITCAMFYLDVSDLSTRLYLAQGSVLILVAMKFMINRDLPAIDYLMYIDYIFFLAYFCCCVAIAISCVDYVLWKKHQLVVRQINKYAVWIPLLLFVITYLIIVGVAKSN